MAEPYEEPKFEQVVQKIIPRGKLRRAWPLKGGISAEMIALEIEQSDGQAKKLIVRRPGEASLKQNPQAASDEFKLLQWMRAMGLATPEPYYLDQSGQIFTAPYLVIDYIEGKIEFAPVDLAGFTRQLATHLAMIHQVGDAAQALSFLPGGTKKFVEKLGEQPAELNESLAEGRIRETLAAVWPLASRNAPALLHGDFWPGNILWREDQLVAVIDWEDARLGDPLVDLAITRLDLVWIFGIEAMQTFTHHYQALMPLDYTHLPYWDLWAALRLIRLAGADLAEWVAFYPPFGRHDITEQTLREQYHFFITQAFAAAKKLG